MAVPQQVQGTTNLGENRVPEGYRRHVAKKEGGAGYDRLFDRFDYEKNFKTDILQSCWEEFDQRHKGNEVNKSNE